MFNASPKLSKASKMPCRSWSLEALTTCPASKNKDGSLVAACSGCYATTGNYRFPNVKAPRIHNQTDWQQTDWVAAMVSELDNDRYFRWFDSGDLYNIKLAYKVLAVMRLTPWVKHWLPTRMFKFDKFKPILEQMQALDNVVVRYSSDSVNGGIVDAAASSTIIPDIEALTDDMTLCRSFEQAGKCEQCRQCWDKSTPVIAYVAHGSKMAKTIRLLNVR